MALLLSTTGNVATVIIEDLGARSFSHPTTNFDLETEYDLWELLESIDLRTSLANNEITLSFDSIPLNIFNFDSLARGNMITASNQVADDYIYDADGNNKVDEADISDTSITSSTATDSNALEGQNGAYYLDRVNHTGTQLASTISDFTTESRSTLSVDPGSQQHLQYDSVTGIFTVTPDNLVNVFVDNIYATFQEWIDNVYVLDPNFYGEGDLLILAAGVPASESWVRNSNPTNGTSGLISDWTLLSNDFSEAEIRALFSSTAPLTYDPITGVYGITKADGTTDGYLSSIDWNTFNSKQNTLTAGSGIDITLDTISLDILNYTAPGAISVTAQTGQTLALASDVEIRLDSSLVNIEPTNINQDAKLKLEPSSATNISAIDFYNFGDVNPTTRIFNDQVDNSLTIASLGHDLKLLGTGGVVDIQSTLGIVKLQGIQYPISTAGNSGDILVYDGVGELTFQQASSGLTAGDGIDITTNSISVDLSPNSGLEFLTAQLKIADSIAGSGLTLTSGILSVDPIDLTTGVSGVLPPINGGTGVDGSTAANGQLLIGNGTGYALSTLASTGTITITNGAGTISLDVAPTSIDSTHIDWGITGNQVNASDIPIIDTAGNYVATNVEDALTEISTALDNISGNASDIIYDGSTSGLAATNVQDAIDEVNANIPTSTDELPEGTTNLYYTDTRVDSRISVTSIDAFVDVDTTTLLPTNGQVLSWDGTNWIPGSPATDLVTSVFGRIGDVVAVAGDYNATQITYDNNSSTLIATDTQAAIDELDVRVVLNDAKVSADGSIDTHSDVDTTTVVPTTSDMLQWDGTNWIPAAPKRSWTISAGTSNNRVSNRYLNWFAGSHNVSPYIMPLNAIINIISAGTRVNESWIAEVRVNGAVVADMTIVTADSGVSAPQGINVNAGDKITFYCNGTNINRPSMSVLFDER